MFNENGFKHFLITVLLGMIIGLCLPLFLLAFLSGCAEGPRVSMKDIDRQNKYHYQTTKPKFKMPEDPNCEYYCLQDKGRINYTCYCYGGKEAEENRCDECEE